VNDRTAEPTETFTVQITSVSGATIADGTGTVTIVDNDGALTAVEPAPAGTVVRPLTQAALDQAAAGAKRIWRAMLPGADLGGVTFVVGDLPELQLAFTLGDTVVVDATAAGWGWSVMHPQSTAPRMDLLAALVHELGHALGFGHEDADALAVMSPTLAASTGMRTVALSPKAAPMPGSAFGLVRLLVVRPAPTAVATIGPLTRTALKASTLRLRPAAARVKLPARIHGTWAMTAAAKRLLGL
jgi:hypothetical protein